VCIPPLPPVFSPLFSPPRFSPKSPFLSLIINITLWNTLSFPPHPVDRRFRDPPRGFCVEHRGSSWETVSRNLCPPCVFPPKVCPRFFLVRLFYNPRCPPRFGAHTVTRVPPCVTGINILCPLVLGPHTGGPRNPRVLPGVLPVCVKTRSRGNSRARNLLWLPFLGLLPL